MRKAILTASAAAVALAASAGYAAARDQIQIVGSSTVFPFTTAVAEKLGQGGQFKTPVVELTGTGGGMKLFCSGVGENTPDFTNASRAIKDSELADCKANGATPVEIKVGFDGIVLANSKAGAAVDLTKEQIFKALAKNVAVDGKVVANPYVNWSDIDASLPATKIEVLGPPPTSGTRDAFVELVMVEACQDEVKAANEKACPEIREDGAYVEAGENDNLIVQKLEANANAFGIFGLLLPRPERRQAAGSQGGRRRADLREHRFRRLQGVALALHLRQEGTCRRHPRHGRVHRRIHVRRRMGSRRLSGRQGPDPAAGRGARHCCRKRKGAEGHGLLIVYRISGGFVCPIRVRSKGSGRSPGPSLS